MAKEVAVIGLAVLGVALTAFGGYYVIDEATAESRHDVTIENESFSATGDALASFNNSQLARADYDATVTVRNASDGSIFDESGNYTWFEANGTLEVTANSDLANATTAEITYGYFGQELGQTGLTTIFHDYHGDVLAPVAFIGFIVFLIAAFAVMGAVA